MDETNQPLLQTGASQAALETVLDSLDALVYVADMQTHELLFLNAYGRARWGQVDQRTCWETLQQGQDGPCSFCNNHQLIDDQGQPAAVQVWEFRNTHNQRWYQCRDQAIRWPDGRLGTELLHCGRPVASSCENLSQTTAISFFKTASSNNCVPR